MALKSSFSRLGKMRSNVSAQFFKGPPLFLAVRTKLAARVHAVEDDPRYRRVDSSDEIVYEARRNYAASVLQGEAGINLAKAALYISAEDDALVSHSSVPLPVDQFLRRIEKLSGELARIHLVNVTDPDAVLEVVQSQLFSGHLNFRIPEYGRSNVPANSILEHPGVWENANEAYLHHVLIRKVGIAATLAIVLSQVMQNLLTCGALDFAVRVDCTGLDRLPEARILKGLTREALLRQDGTVMNTCTSDTLVELLRFLKRSFWPFAWHTGSHQPSGNWSGGSGFKGAAQVALEGEASADLQAISRTAKHRLDRGIWTSSGAGDLRRAKAAAERLCLLIGESCPRERRDAAVLMLHAGEHAQALAELEAYHSSRQYRTEASAEEKNLVDKLLSALSIGAGSRAAREPITAESTLQMAPPVESAVLPLTW